MSVPSSYPYPFVQRRCHKLLRLAQHTGRITFFIQEISERVKRGLEDVIAEAQTTVTIDTLPTLKANPSQMGQVLQNLIGNILRYTGTHAPMIDVSATKKLEHWRIAVRDNGVGLDQQYSERNVAIFQRLHMRTQYSGTALGLAICKKVAELHGERYRANPCSMKAQPSTSRFHPRNPAIIDGNADKSPALNL